MSQKPRVIVEVRDGLVVGIVADRAIEAVVVDHDTDGVPAEALREFPAAKGHTELVTAIEDDVDVSKGFIQAALKKLGLWYK
jgi:hypothetical protein